MSSAGSSSLRAVQLVALGRQQVLRLSGSAGVVVARLPVFPATPRHDPCVSCEHRARCEELRGTVDGRPIAEGCPAAEGWVAAEAEYRRLTGQGQLDLWGHHD